MARVADEEGQAAAGRGARTVRQSRLADEDRRLVLVTFAGTLAANLVTVVIVGGALAFIHSLRSSGVGYGPWPLAIVFGVGPVALYAMAKWGMPGAIKERLKEPFEPFPFSAVQYARFTIVLGWLYAALILIGEAAGIK